MGVNPIVDYDCTQAQLVDRLSALKPQGHQLVQYREGLGLQRDL
jgi:hypothetical protein